MYALINLLPKTFVDLLSATDDEDFNKSVGTSSESCNESWTKIKIMQKIKKTIISDSMQKPVTGGNRHIKRHK